MKPLRAFLAAVAITVFNFLLGGLSCGCLFTWVYGLEPTNIWRNMDGPPGVDFLIATLVWNILFIGVFLLLRRGIPGANVYVKGLVFGLCVWAVGVLPGMHSMYAFMTVATQVIVYWTILGLIKLLLDGLIVAAICARPERE